MIFNSIETQRLILRELNKDDFASIHSYASDSEVSQYLPWGPNSEADTQVFLNKIIKYQCDSPRYDYEIAVVTKEDNKLIGVCAIHISNPSNREGWIGYCYNKEYWGNGYASEAAKEIIEFGFTGLDLHRIFATCDPNNIGSAKVLEKIGMKREGHLRENKWQKGKWRDSFVYSILKHEYKKGV
ncbi:GNAT family N-acetyltransferase [Tissierella sp. MSJ-40]|uniref:GNAT family N-acetyltransferase n=1 Tax=Tissierella simiarum TaxID=2841534 RepID=A0ABS6E455_9FIRM|nr:GNAT family protein [Tissierella simiarum]MBU5437361.1 GNAT family N-acetyltransferase [Tissierella simiarum]